MNIYELYILSAFDFSMLLLLTCSIFMSRYKYKATYVAAIAIGAVGTVFIGQAITEPVLSRAAVIGFVYFYLYLIIMKDVESYLDYTLGFVLVLVITYSVQIVLLILLTLALGTISFDFLHGLIAQASALIVLSLITYYLNINKLYTYIKYRNIWLRSILITSLAVYFTISILWDLNVEGFINSLLMIGITLLVVLLVNTLVIKGSISDKKNKEKLAIYETYLPIIDDIIDEIKVKQHDYHNQVQTIALLKKELKSDYETYLEDITRKDIWDKLILLENKVLMAFLYSKYKEANDLEIDLSFHLKVFDLESVYTDYELVEMFGILIDNALEAVSGDKRVDVWLDFRSKNVLKVTNPVDDFKTSDIPGMFEFHKSSKGLNRGIGLYKLKALLDREKGTINVFYDTQTQLLSVEICFN